ncbi:TPA: hypothetical protein H1012_01705 [archaeon]|nr:hypothetical protein [Candidatus Naiadarchaeales archaeon SRR2090153.bin461]HIK02541.1 hypothetical protein [Candidatus Naiadarchaeales archaeon SRR2090159.bin1288]
MVETKRLTTILSKNEFLSPNTKLFRFDFQKGESYDFIPGQFVMIAIKDETGKEHKRAYSYASPAFEKGYTEYCIKIVPQGALSPRLSAMPIGAQVDLIGPYGKFVVSGLEHDLLFIAAGTGIAPFRAMIKQLLHDGFKKKIHLLYGFHSEEDYMFKDELESLAKSYPNLILRITASAPEKPGDWMHDTGRVTSIVPKYVKDKNLKAFICGPPAMVKDTVEELKKIGYNEKEIHLDVWG